MQLDKWTLIQFHMLPSDTYWIISSFPDFLTLSRLLSGNFAMLSHTLTTTLWGNFILTLKKGKMSRFGQHVTWEDLLIRVCFLGYFLSKEMPLFQPTLNPHYNGIQQNTQYILLNLGNSYCFYVHGLTWRGISDFRCK